MKEQKHKNLIRLFRHDTPAKIWKQIQCEGDCWIWTGCTSKGVPITWLKERKRKKIKTLRVGRIICLGLSQVDDRSVVVNQSCHNNRCVSPKHLRSETISQKNKRSFAHRVLETCRQGLHPLEGDNLIVHKNGQRRCKKCSKASRKRWRDKQKQVSLKRCV